MMGDFALCLKYSNHHLVSTEDHLVKEKIILNQHHLSTNVVKSTKPNVHLLCN